MNRNLLLGAFVVAGAAYAQGTCPHMTFDDVLAASLRPSATSQIRLAHQPNGSYTGYELANASPYRTIATVPNFQAQLNTCNGDLSVAYQLPDAFVRLPGGNYLEVAGAPVVPQGIVAYSIRATLFDPSFGFLSEKGYTLPPDPNNPERARRIASVAVADLNGDGNPDIVIAAKLANTDDLWVLLGKGGDTFGEPRMLSTNFQEIVSPPVVADLDGDGRLDILVHRSVIGTPGSKIVAFYGKGDGTFEAPVELFVAWGHASITVADVNRDAKPDLIFTVGAVDVVEASQPYVSVALATGNRTFAAPIQYAVANSTGLAVGDVDGDGNPDIVANGTTIWFGDGTGAFRGRTDYAANFATGVILTDFDGDGKTDIVLANGNAGVIWGPSVAVLKNLGNGQFAVPSATPVALNQEHKGDMHSTLVFDVNRDGIPDLVRRDYNRVLVLLGDGSGRFPKQLSFDVPGEGPMAVIDSDGDLAVGSAETLYIYKNRGDGTFQQSNSLPLGALLMDVRAVDLNRDGKVDVVANTVDETAPYVGEFQLFYGSASGGFGPPVVFPTSASAGSTGLDMMTVADFNGDGRPDIAALSGNTYPAPNNAQITMLLSRTAGGFDRTVIPQTTLPPAIAAADLNGDGKADLIGQFPNEVAVALGRGDGTFGAWTNLPTNSPRPGAFPPWPSLRIADLNGDRILDILSCGGRGADVYLGYGDGTFQPLVPALGCIVADMNGDGSPDIVDVDLATSRVAVYFNRTQPPAAVVIVPSASMQPGPIAPGSLATAFGTDLAGATISVTDANGGGHAAQVIYASPTQVNFVVPADLSGNSATVAITNGAGLARNVAITLAATAPSIFIWGGGAAAAGTVTVGPDGGQVYRIANEPIDVSQPNTRVYLVLYGTGFRTATTSGVKVWIQGLPAPVSYAGPQGTVTGLDQINALIPSELAGTGVSSVVVTVGTAQANTTQITIK